MKKFLFLLLLPCVTASVFSQDSTPEEVFVVAEEMPRFPGGKDTLARWLEQQMQYPEKEKKQGIGGTVYLSFIVNNQGKIKDIKVLRGVENGPGLEKEAVRLVQAMPDWSPGKQNGIPVNVQFNLPVKFDPANVLTRVNTWYEKGQLKGDYKYGVWEYYDDKTKEPALKVDYTTGQILLVKKDTSDFVILNKNEWQKSKLDTAPRYLGSMRGFYEQLHANMHYPPHALNNRTVGTVYVSFEIDTTGEAGNFTIVYDIGNGCGFEVLKALNLVPAYWLPAKKDGKVYKARFLLPVQFIIELNGKEFADNIRTLQGLPPAKMMEELKIKMMGKTRNRY